jgi:hypothetical protein
MVALGGARFQGQLVLGPGAERAGSRPRRRAHGVDRGLRAPHLRAVDTLVCVTDSLLELSARLHETAGLLRAGELEPEATLALIEECARLASDATSQVDQRVRAALEPLPDLPGQLPLPAA